MKGQNMEFNEIKFDDDLERILRGEKPSLDTPTKSKYSLAVLTGAFPEPKSVKFDIVAPDYKPEKLID